MCKTYSMVVYHFFVLKKFPIKRCFNRVSRILESNSSTDSGFLFTDSLTMAQVEKRGGLLRKSSASKKPLKEKVVLMYDEIFMVRPEALILSMA